MAKTNNRLGLNYVTIAGVNITSTPKDHLLAIIKCSLKKKNHPAMAGSITVFTPNPEMIVEAQYNQDFKKALNNSDINLPDGTGLLLVNTSLSRIRGREFFLDLLKLANVDNLKIFLLGSSKKVIDKSITNIKSNYPIITIKGDSGFKLNKNAQPVSDLDIAKQIDIVNEINQFKPDILFVAFGAPKQELWITQNKTKLKVKVLMGIGGTLDYFSSQTSLPPKFISTLGFEWLWRLIKEPKRISRIIKAVIIFPLLILKQKFKK